MVKGPALLLVMFLVLFCPAAGWSDGCCSGRSAGSGEQRFPSGFSGPTLGQVQDEFPGRGRDPCQDLDEFAPDGAAARCAEIGAGERADGAGQVERDRCQDQPVCVRGENTRRQVAQLPYLGWQNVLVGVLLVSLGLDVYALRSHSRPQDRDTHDDLVQRLETPQMRASRRPARETESER